MTAKQVEAYIKRAHHLSHGQKTEFVDFFTRHFPGVLHEHQPSPPPAPIPATASVPEAADVSRRMKLIIVLQSCQVGVLAALAIIEILKEVLK